MVTTNKIAQPRLDKVERYEANEFYKAIATGEEEGVDVDLKINQAFSLYEIRFSCSVAGGELEGLEITLDSADGSKHDIVIDTVDMDGKKQHIYIPTAGERRFSAGDVINVAYTNIGNGDWGLQFIYRTR